MHLTKGSEYALRGLACLAEQPPGGTMALSELAEAAGLPTAFLAKIFQELARHGLLTAGRGRGSGYALARPADRITIAEIFEAVEGPRLAQRCLLWSGYCADANPCPLHEYARHLMTAVEEVLTETTLADFAAGGADGGRATPVVAAEH